MDKVGPACKRWGRYNFRTYSITPLVHHLQEALCQIKLEQLHIITHFNFPFLCPPLTSIRPTDMVVKLAASVFVGFALESILYGVFIMTFAAAAVTQWERRKCEKLRTVNKLVIGFSILLLGFISTVSVSRTPFKSCIQVGIALDPQFLEMLRRLPERIRYGHYGRRICQSKERNQFGPLYRVRGSGVDGRLPLGNVSLSDCVTKHLPSILKGLSTVLRLWS